MEDMAVPCLKCGETGVVLVSVDDGSLVCSQCDEEYTVQDVEQHLAQWGRVLPWLRAHPALQ